MRDDPSQKIIGVSASGFCLKERLGNLRNVIDQNSDEMRIAMIAMQDEQFDHQTFMKVTIFHFHIKTCQTVTLSNELSIYCLSIYISHTPPASSTQKPYQNHSLCPPSPIAAK